MMEGSGKQLDAVVLEAFLGMLKQRRLCRECWSRLSLSAPLAKVVW